MIIILSLSGLSVLPFFTTSATTVATATPTIATIITTTTGSTMPPTTTPITTRQPITTRRPYTTRRTTTAAPITSIPPTAPTTTSPSKAQRPCDSQPCGHGGTCEEDGDDFTCTCPAGRGGAVCEKGKMHHQYISIKRYKIKKYISQNCNMQYITGVLNESSA